MVTENVSDCLRNLMSRGYTVINGIESGEYLNISESLGTVFDVQEISYLPGKNAKLHSCQAMSLHSDHPDANFVSWYCVSQSDIGGESLLLDFQDIAAHLSEKQLDDLRQVEVKFPTLEHKGFAVTTLLSKAGLYYSGWLIDPVFRGATKPCVLEVFEHLLEALPKISIRLEIGQSLIINNKRMLHGRSAFQGEGSRRSLIRHWIQ
ncbi:MAG: TauD/TfdA family dioxygenase [Pseudomonadota bacterium]